MQEALMFTDLDDRFEVPILTDATGAQFVVLDTNNDPHVLLINAILAAVGITSTVTIGNTLPPNPVNGQLVMFNADVASGLANIGSAKSGDFVQYQTDTWVRVFRISDLVPIGTKVTIGNTLSATPQTDEIVIFNADVASGLDDITDAKSGDFVKYSGTEWVRELRISDFVSSGTPVIIGGAFPPTPETGQLVLFNVDVASGLADIDSAKLGDWARYNGTTWTRVFRLPISATPTNLVYRTDFEPQINDYYYVVTSDWAAWTNSQNTKQGSIAFFVGEPASGTIQFHNTENAIDFSGVTHVWLGRSFDSADTFIYNYKNIVAPTVDTVFYVHQDNPYHASPYAKMTVTAVEAVGSGDSLWYKLTVTTQQTGGNIGNNAAGQWRITENAPGDITVPGNQVEVDNSFLGRLRKLSQWPAAMSSGLTAALANNIPGISTFINALKAKLSPLFALLDGTNLTAEFRRAVQRFNEEIDLTGTYQRVSSLSVPTAGQWSINNTPTRTAPAQIQFAPKTSDVTPFSLGIAAGTYIDLSSTCTVEVTHDSISVANNLWTFRVTLVEGTLPAENASNAIHLEGADIHRTEISREAFRAHSPNIQGDGGKKGTAYTINSSGEIEWQDYVPLDALYTEVFSRTEGTGLTTTNGESYLSSDNTPPSGAPSNATTFLGVDHHTSDGTDQSALLNAIKVGEWMFVRVGDTYINARIQFVDQVVAQYATRFWIIPSEAHQHTHAYEELATGAATIAFTNLLPDLDDLVEGTPANKSIIQYDGSQWEVASLPEGGRGEKIATSADIVGNGSDQNLVLTLTTFGSNNNYELYSANKSIAAPTLMPESRGTTHLLVVASRVSSGTATEVGMILLPWSLDVTNLEMGIGATNHGVKLRFGNAIGAGDWGPAGMKIVATVTGETYRIEIYEWKQGASGGGSGGGSDFDIHDDIATELATLADDDRFATSDESASGDPMLYVKASTLATYVHGKIKDYVEGLTTTKKGELLEAMGLGIGNPIIPNTVNRFLLPTLGGHVGLILYDDAVWLISAFDSRIDKWSFAGVEDTSARVSLNSNKAYSGFFHDGTDWWALNSIDKRLEKWTASGTEDTTARLSLTAGKSYYSPFKTSDAWYVLNDTDNRIEKWSLTGTLDLTQSVTLTSGKEYEAMLRTDNEYWVYNGTDNVIERWRTSNGQKDNTLEYPTNPAFAYGGMAIDADTGWWLTNVSVARVENWQRQLTGWW